MQRSHQISIDLSSSILIQAPDFNKSLEEQIHFRTKKSDDLTS